jgi:hypothetical protein
MHIFQQPLTMTISPWSPPSPVSTKTTATKKTHDVKPKKDTSTTKNNSHKVRKDTDVCTIESTTKTNKKSPPTNDDDIEFIGTTENTSPTDISTVSSTSDNKILNTPPPPTNQPPSANLSSGTLPNVVTLRTTSATNSVTASVSNRTSTIRAGFRNPTPPRPIANFEIQPRNIQVPNRDPPITRQTSYLRAAIVASPPGETHVVFRFERVDTDTSSWAEKLLNDAVQNRTPWVTHANITQDKLLFFENNVKQVNTKGYPIRMFFSVIPGNYNFDSVVNKAEEICSHLQATPGLNYRVAHFDEPDLLWMDDTVVWSEILGGQQAYDRLVKLTEQPSPGYFDRHHQTLFYYFHDQTFNHALQSLFYAPPSVLHPDLLPTND